MRNHRNLMMIAPLAAAALLAGCATKKQDLPPPPPTQAAPPAGDTMPAPVQPMADSYVGTTSIPGSVADFVARAGSDKVLFGYDSYELDDSARTTLGRQAEWLQRYPDVRVTVEGHADERGTREYNLALGDRRATAMRNFLSNQGVGAGRITTISYGKERPAIDGSDESAWAQNRRGVTVITAGAR